MKKLLTIIIMLIAILPASAQVEMADKMRADGKIYVVVTVVFIIMSGILIYLYMLDRKISALEKKMKNK